MGSHQNSLAILCLALFASAGCSKASSGCSPACGPGTRCDEASGACLPDPIDMAASGNGDGGAVCSPACSGMTLKCNAKKRCVGCLVDGDCAIGSYCNVMSDLVATCAPGCKDDSRCGAGHGCCGNQCVDLMTSSDHCGACGTSCAGLHAAATCALGACQIGMCNPGWGDCNHDPKDGCEANLHADPKNCTACGMGCSAPNSLPACADGCYFSGCQFGFDNCDGKPDNGCETPVSADSANCGGCGVKCTNPPNGTASCVDAACVISACANGYTDCDGDPKNGCEVNTAHDAKNCGKCGNVCPMNTPSCNNGVCA